MLTGLNRRNRGRMISQAVLESLETRTLLTNTAPVLDAIPAVSMSAAASTTQLPKTFQVPLTASDVDGDALTYTVTSSNSNIVPIMHTGDPFMKLTVGSGEVQSLKGSAAATAGTYTLSFGGNTTTALSFDATIAQVQAALRLLPGLSSVVVSGSPLTSTSGLVFGFPLASGDVDQITIDPAALTPTITYTPTETKSWSGDMWLMLYKEWAPTTVQNIVGFLNAGFYNNLTFHRIIKGFMAQGGDPQGTGQGGPGFQFKDEFNQNLIFSNRGQLAMANSGDDTNGSQFFITDAAFRFGDFNYTIWGQLVRGFTTLDNLVNVPVTDSSSGTPIATGSVQIISAAIVPDPTDTAITLSAKKAGSATITVTANDGHGGTSVKTFTVTATADTTNDAAFMKNLTDLTTPVDQPISIPLSAIDLEGDGLSFDGLVSTSDADPVAHATLVKDGATITVVPEKGYTGVITLVVGVNRTVNRSSTGDTDSFDKETITIAVGGKAIHAKPLGYAAVAGSARTSYLATFTCDNPILVAGNFSAGVNWGDGSALGTGTVVASGTTFFVVGTHTYANAGEYPLTVTLTQSSLAQQVGAVTSVRALAEVAAAPQTDHTTTIINAGIPIVARQSVSFWQWGSVSSSASTLSATVNWGDGTATAALTLSANGNFKLLHTYKKVGKFYITVTVNDGSGTPAVQRVLATVLAAGPKAVISGDKSGITGQTRSLFVHGSDAGSNIPAGNYWYSINWGDGTSTQTTDIGTAGLAHRYWKTGTFNATVRIYDPWGGTGTVTTYPVKIASAMLQTDPFNQTQSLYVGGTQANDKILVGIGTKGVSVTVNGSSIGQFLPSGFIYVWGYDGNDTITVDPKLTVICSIFGGTGNDAITGGGGYTIAVGGDGNDTIKGSSARSILMGGAGADKITGQKNDDILVGGTTAWDDDPVRLIYLLAEWVQATAYATRVGHLNGTDTTTSGQNGGLTLEYQTVNSALQQTVYDDGVVDTLTGGSGTDWFLANQTTVAADAAKKDNVTDKLTAEQVLNVLT